MVDSCGCVTGSAGAGVVTLIVGSISGFVVGVVSMLILWVVL